MKAVYRTTGRINAHVSAGRVLYGESTCWKHRIDYSYPLLSLNEKRGGLKSFVSAHSSGKTVLIKRNACYWRWLWPNRPGIIIEAQGFDWRTIKYPGREGIVYKKHGEDYWGFGSDLINYTPVYLSDMLVKGHELFDDQLFGFSWKDLTADEWGYLFAKSTEGKTWIYKFVSYLESHKEELFRFGDIISEAEKMLKSRWKYKDNKLWYNSPILPEYLNQIELISLLGSLKPMYESGFLLDPDDERLVSIPYLLRNGLVANFNFWGDQSEKTNLYKALILRKTREYIFNQYKKTFPHLPNAPWIIWEEADKSAPAGEKTMSGIQMYEIINKDMKFGYLFALVLQYMSRIQSSVRESMLQDPIYCARPSDDDKKLISHGRKDCLSVLSNLDLKRDEQKRFEWAGVYDSGQTIYTFRPGASPCEFLQRLS